MLGKMHFNGEGGPTDVVEARRLLELAAAQDHAGVRAALEVVNKASDERRAKKTSDADAMMALLLAEDTEEKKKGAAKSKKNKKKGGAKSTSPPSATPSTSGGGGASAADTSDAALRAAMAAGELEGLLAAIEEHREIASELVLREAEERAAAVGKAQRAAAQRVAAAQKVAAERAEAAEKKRAAAERAAVEKAAAERAVAKRAAAAEAAEMKRAAAEREEAERAAAEQAAEQAALEKAVAQSMASLQADEERRLQLLAAASLANAAAVAPPDSAGGGRLSQWLGTAEPVTGQGRPVGLPAIDEALQGVRLSETPVAPPDASQLWFAGGAGRGAEPAESGAAAAVAAASAQPGFRSLADIGDITGRNNVPESSLGGETTCIVCFVHPKTHLAAPCGHQCVCGPCAARMQTCPYCRAPVQLWVQQRMV